jgi:hypothetical protein
MARLPASVIPVKPRPWEAEVVLAGGVAVVAATGAVALGPVALGIPIALAIAAVLLREPLALLALFLSIGLFKDEAVVRALPVDATLALGVLLALVCGMRLVSSRFRGVPFAFALTIAVVSLSLVVSLAWSRGGDYGHDKVTTYLTVTMLAIGAPFFLFEHWGDLLRFFTWIVVVAVPASAVALTDPARDTGRLAGHNTIGTSHLLCTAALILVLLALRRSRWRLPAAVAAAGFIAIAAATGSRGPLLSLAVALVVVVSAWLLRAPRKVAPVLAIAGVGLAVVPFVSLPATSSERLAATARDPIGAFRQDDRSYLVDQAIQLVDRDPIRGAGAGAFSTVNPAAKWPHNLFLELWSELGVVTMLLVAAAIIAALVGLFRLAWRLPTGRVEQELVYVLLAVFFFNVLTVQITGDINQNRTFWGMLAIAWLVVVKGLTTRVARAG